MFLTHKEAAIITKGKTNTIWQGIGFSIDSRRINQGNIFIALKGNNYNGHNFIHDAFKNGASAAIVNESENIKEYEKYPILIVKDTYQALLDIAKNNRTKYKGKIIAITGSVGKTTTKEMFKIALKDLACLYTSKGNLNNHIGMPLCLANIDSNSELAIFELGMNSPQEISFLSKILQPHYAIITEVSRTHSAFFNSLDEIFLSKMEIIHGLIKKPKILIFNINNQFFHKAKQIVENSDIKVFGFGKLFNQNNKKDNLLINNNSQIKQLNNKNYKKLHNISKFTQFDLTENSNHLDNNILEHLTEEILNTETLLNSKTNFLFLKRKLVTKIINKQIKFNQEILVKIGDVIYKYNLPTLSEHKGVLSTLVLGVIFLLNYNVKKAIYNLKNYTDVKGRGNFNYINIKQHNIGFYLLDDSYNASPLSMKKSILSLKEINLSNRKILILGDMLELSNEIYEHQKLKKYILEVNPDAVFTLGNNMKYLIDVLPSYINKYTYLNENILLKKLIRYLQNDDILLIKGSLGSNVYKVAQELYNLNF